MNLEGHIRVSAAFAGGRLRQVAVDSDRPLIGDVLLRGRAIADAPEVLPLALALCGRAQSVVCAAACEAALGLETQAAQRERRARELAAETVQEHAWRVLLDWPRLAREPEDVELLGRIRALTRTAAESDAAWGVARDALLSIVSSRVLGGPADAWIESRGAAHWLEWAAAGRTATARVLQHFVGLSQGGRGEVHLLAWPTAERVAGSIAVPALADPGFARSPTLAGLPQETGPLPRLVRHSALAELARTNAVAARAFARLAELVALLLGLVAQGGPESASLGPGRGAAWAEMARGLLTHAVETDGETVLRYSIVAPTEWNFHPEGALRAGLEGRPVAGIAEARHLLDVAASVLDPCVELDVDVHDA